MNWYKIAQLALVFEHIHEDYHNEQHEYVLVAKDASTEQPVGMIEYCLFRDQVYIQNILVKKNLREQGIGTQMVEDLKREHNTIINWGMMTPEGSSLYDSMDNPTNA